MISNNKESNKIIKESKEFLSKNKSKYDIYSHIIDEMIFLTEDTYPSTVKFINEHKDIFFKDHSSALFFFKNIIHSAKENFRRFELNLNIIIEFSSEFRKLNITDEEIIEPNMYFNSIYYLFKAHFFTIESIMKISTKNVFIYILFLPEITEYDPEYAIVEEDALFRVERPETEQNNLKNFFEFVKKNPEKHLIYRELNYHPSTLHKAIREDNIEEFQMLLSMNNFKLNHRFDFSYYERIEMMDEKPSLADIAAVYGSVKIFKFLWMQKDFVVDSNLLHYAYFGCNFDIIHICEEKCSELHVCRQPIFAHRYDLLNYYLERYEEVLEDEEIKEKLVNFVVPKKNEEEDEEEDDECFELYQKLDYDALLFALRGFNYVVFRKCFAKICHLIQFFEFNNPYWSNNTFSSFSLMTSCIYDVDLFMFFYHLKNDLFNEPNSIVIENILYEVVEVKANDTFKKIFEEGIDPKSIFIIFANCLAYNVDLANFMLDYQFEEKNSNKANSIFNEIKSEITENYLNLVIIHYNEDLFIKMVNLYDMLTIENAERCADFLKTKISSRMASSLIEKLSRTLSSDIIEIFRKTFNL